MAQRLVRAKRKIKAARIPYRLPEEHDLPDRLQSVLAVIYLIYNAGLSSPAGDELRAEAIRLARTLTQLMPDEPEAAGLLALLLLTDARAPARSDANGALVVLDSQGRTRWDRTKIEEGHAIVRRCLRGDQPGPYQLQAAINAVHTDARTAEQTDWKQIVALYDQLIALWPTPVVALNRAIAIGEVHGDPTRRSRSSTTSTSTATPPTTPPGQTSWPGSDATTRPATSTTAPPNSLRPSRSGTFYRGADVTAPRQTSTAGCRPPPSCLATSGSLGVGSYRSSATTSVDYLASRCPRAVTTVVARRIIRLLPAEGTYSKP